MTEIDPTFTMVLQVWWSYAWRNLLMILVSIVLGAIIGFICGILGAAIGLAPSTIRIVVMPIGFLMGLALSVLPMYWIIGKDYGDFRLILVSNYPTDRPQEHSLTA